MELNEYINIECGNCSNGFSIPLKTATTDWAIVHCPKCNIEITIFHNGSGKRQNKEANIVIAALVKIMKKFGNKS